MRKKRVNRVITEAKFSENSSVMEQPARYLVVKNEDTNEQTYLHSKPIRHKPLIKVKYEI
jgi:hypothetical protein